MVDAEMLCCSEDIDSLPRRRHIIVDPVLPPITTSAEYGQNVKPLVRSNVVSISAVNLKSERANGSYW